MRPILYFAIKAAEKYRRTHNVPERMELTDEILKQKYDENVNRNYDCFSVDEKLKKGLSLEKVDLPNCGGWLITKEGNPKDKILYYIHGGGFYGGCTRERFEFVSYAVDHFGYNMFSIDYRMAPNYKCIDTVKDCEDGYLYLLKNYDPKRIVALGESAGANLVLVLPQKLKEDGIEMPGGLVANSPVVQFLHYAYSYYECSLKTDYGITFGINDTIEGYRGDLPLDHHYLSPLCGDLSGYPSTYLDASDSESLRDEARMMYVRLREEGTDVEYHELREFFHAMMPAPKFRFVRKEEYPLILSFINRVMNKKEENP